MTGEKIELKFWPLLTPQWPPPPVWQTSYFYSFFKPFLNTFLYFFTTNPKVMGTIESSLSKCLQIQIRKMFMAIWGAKSKFHFGRKNTQSTLIGHNSFKKCVFWFSLSPRLSQYFEMYVCWSICLSVMVHESINECLTQFGLKTTNGDIHPQEKLWCFLNEPRSMNPLKNPQEKLRF